MVLDGIPVVGAGTSVWRQNVPNHNEWPAAALSIRAAARVG
jgi:hypothetical protein